MRGILFVSLVLLMPPAQGNSSNDIANNIDENDTILLGTTSSATPTNI